MSKKEYGDVTHVGQHTYSQTKPPVLTPGTLALLQSASSAEGAVASVTDGGSDPLRVFSSGVWAHPTSPLVTTTAITTLIDYTNGVTIPAGVKFTSQADIDAFLNGAPGFKYLMDFWEATPQNLAFPFTINMTPEVHRPRPGDTQVAWRLVGKSVVDQAASFALNGNSTYSTVVAAQTVTSNNAGASGGNPYVRVAGTPYAGLNLRGHYAVLSTGQYAAIHRNDSDTLYVLPQLSPAPTNGVTTVTVMTPSTILRNSLTDLVSSQIAKVALYISIKSLPPTNANSTSFFTYTTFSSFTVDPFGPPPSGTSYGIVVRGADSMTWDRVVVDEATYFDLTGGITARQGCVDIEMVNPSSGIYAKGVVVRAPEKANESIHYVLLVQGGVFFVRSGFGAFFSGGDGAISITSLGSMTCPNTVFEGMGDTGSTSVTGLVQVLNRSIFSPGGVTTGCYTTIRDCLRAPSATDQAALVMHERGRITVSAGHIYFSNCDMDCVRIGAYSGVMMNRIADTKPLFANGALPNSRYGVRMIGPYASAQMHASTNVSGSLGEVRFADSDVLWSSITASGPYVDGQTFNQISR